MTTKARALGAIFDIGYAVPIRDLDGGAQTGLIIDMSDCEGITFLVVKEAASTDDIALDLQEVDAVAGTPRDLDIITDYFIKHGTTTSDGTETWEKVTQAAASEITAIAGSAEQEYLLAFEVRADQLSDGYTHIQVNVPDLGSAGAEFGGIIAIKWGLKAGRAPANMPAFTR